MEAELLEIREFLERHVPFDRLPAARLDTLPRQITIRYLRRGTPFPPDDSRSPPSLTLLRKGAIEFRDEAGLLLEKLVEGDLYTLPCRGGGDAAEPHAHGTVSEDALLYQLSCERLSELCAASPPFRRHFERTLQQRLERATRLLQYEGDTSLSTLTAADLLRRPPVTATTTTTIRAAAELMSREHISALPIVSGDGRVVGIITDRDLRSRCIAPGRPTGDPIETIMSGSPQSVTAVTPLFSAQEVMFNHGIHHLPVVDEEGRVLGIISSGDLLHQQQLNTVSLSNRIARAASVEELALIGRQLPELQLQLVRAGTAYEHVCQVIGNCIDTLNRRLLALAEERFGPPPHPYVWLVLGSQGRAEQLLPTDQDNALLIDDGLTREGEAYFTTLAEFVCNGLAACGIAPCPGEVMASNPRWRQPLQRWLNDFASWVRAPEPMAMMQMSIFFDMRPLHGDTALFDRLQQQVLPQCRQNHIFHAHLVANALHHRPPLGFLRQFVLVHDGEHDNTLDMKHQAVVPIVDIARLLVLTHGLPPRNTIERLQAAQASGAISEESAENLIHAMRFIGSLRLRHRANRRRAGEELNDYIAPEELSRLEQQQLKDAFAVIRTLQRLLEQRYQSGRIF